MTSTVEAYPKVRFSADWRDPLKLVDRHGNDIAHRLRVVSISFGIEVARGAPLVKMRFYRHNWRAYTERNVCDTIRLLDRDGYDLARGLGISMLHESYVHNEMVMLDVEFEAEWF